jgi:hypothetical protein
VLRGGSFNNNRDNARLSYRNHNEPGNHWNNNGFRVGVAAASHNNQLSPQRLRFNVCVDGNAAPAPLCAARRCPGQKCLPSMDDRPRPK